MGLLLVQKSTNVISGLFKVFFENVVLRFLLVSSVLHKLKQDVERRLANRLFHKISVVVFHKVFNKKRIEYLRQCIK